MSNVIVCKQTYENMYTGMRTIELPNDGWQVVKAWLEYNGKGTDVVRGYRVNARGRVTFKTGCGYATFDADLLGGNGDGSAERQFLDDTALYFRVK